MPGGEVGVAAGSSIQPPAKRTQRPLPSAITPPQRESDAQRTRERVEAGKRVADERRRWAVGHFSVTGKPDVRATAEAACARLVALGAIDVETDAALALAAGAHDGGAARASPAPTRATLFHADLLALTAPPPPGSLALQDAAPRETRLRLQQARGPGGAVALLADAPADDSVGAAAVAADEGRARLAVAAAGRPGSRLALQDGSMRAGDITGTSTPGPLPPPLSEPVRPQPLLLDTPRAATTAADSAAAALRWAQGQLARSPEEAAVDGGGSKTRAALHEVALRGGTARRSLHDVAAAGRPARFGQAGGARAGSVAPLTAPLAAAAAARAASTAAVVPPLYSAAEAAMRAHGVHVEAPGDAVAAAAWQRETAVALPLLGGVAAAASAASGIAARLRQRLAPVPPSPGQASHATTSLSFAAEVARGALDEQHDATLAERRMAHLSAQVAATAGQAEMQQHGALLRPLLDGMSRFMLHLAAADGSEAELRAAAALGEDTAAEGRGQGRRAPVSAAAAVTAAPASLHAAVTAPAKKLPLGRAGGAAAPSAEAARATRVLLASQKRLRAAGQPASNAATRPGSGVGAPRGAEGGAPTLVEVLAREASSLRRDTKALRAAAACRRA